MAHFAQLDNNNTVLQVIVVDNTDILDEAGNESEDLGIQFCQSLFGGNWKQCSYNLTFRKNFPGPGYIYDATRDAFIDNFQPFPSWTFSEDTCRYEPPVPHPEDGQYEWDEETLNWEAF